MLRSILVPLDGSEFAEHALPLAAGIARKAGTKLHLATVGKPQGATYLEDVARRLGEAGPVSCCTVVLAGDPVAALAAYVREASIGLVVAESHRRGLLSRMWRHSVAEDLAALLPVPVLLARPGEGKADLASRPELRRVLVPLDGTGLAEEALEPALKLALACGAEIEVVRVFPPTDVLSNLAEGAGAHCQALLDEAEKADRQHEREAQRYLDGVAALLKERGARVLTRVVRDPKAAQAIVRAAEDDHADLIVMESHGRRGLAWLFGGSVADDVVHGDRIPVLVQHPA